MLRITCNPRVFRNIESLLGRASQALENPLQKGIESLSAEQEAEGMGYRRAPKTLDIWRRGVVSPMETTKDQQLDGDTQDQAGEGGSSTESLTGGIFDFMCLAWNILRGPTVMVVEQRRQGRTTIRTIFYICILFTSEHIASHGTTLKTIS